MMRTRQSVGNKLSMNTKIITTVTMAIIFAFISLLSLNNLTPINTTVGNKMRVVKTEILNNSNVRWDYLMDQQIISINIETAGKKKAMQLEEISFSLSGNSKYVMNALSSAYLCYTSDNAQFNMDNIVSEEIDIQGKEEFSILLEKQKLKQGVNHYWIVIKPKPGKLANPQDIVIDCNNITINKMKFKPEIPIKLIKENAKKNEADFTF